jgi:hypothetical protein
MAQLQRHHQQLQQHQHQVGVLAAPAQMQAGASCHHPSRSSAAGVQAVAAVLVAVAAAHAVGLAVAPGVLAAAAARLSSRSSSSSGVGGRTGRSSCRGQADACMHAHLPKLMQHAGMWHSICCLHANLCGKQAKACWLLKCIPDSLLLTLCMESSRSRRPCKCCLTLEFPARKACGAHSTIAGKQHCCGLMRLRAAGA